MLSDMGFMGSAWVATRSRQEEGSSERMRTVMSSRPTATYRDRWVPDVTLPMAMLRTCKTLEKKKERQNLGKTRKDETEREKKIKKETTNNVIMVELFEQTRANTITRRI
jgi:hypothetical protein